MTDKLVMYFGEDCFNVLEQTDRYMKKKIQCTPEYSVAVYSYPAFYSYTRHFEIYLRGDDEDEDDRPVYFNSKHLPHIIKAITIFCEKVGWKFEHNLQERIEI